MVLPSSLGFLLGGGMCVLQSWLLPNRVTTGSWERKKARACNLFWKKVPPFSPLAAFIPLLNVKGCWEDWIRLFPSLFWVIFGWFLFPFSLRIGRSNSNFC